jgi:opacity protein-like surface antigen
MVLIRLAVAAVIAALPTICNAADPAERLYGVAPSAFYVGFQGGRIWSTDKVLQYDRFTPLFRMNMGSDPAFGGLHVGYQRIISGVIVGLEADYDRGGRQSTQTYAGTSVFTRTVEMDYRSTVRARLGYEFGALSLYATGGGAMTNLKTTAASDAAPGVQASDNFAFGATLGAGVSYKINRNWAAFSEYRYADFGRVNGQADNGVHAGSVANHRVTETSVRAGASYYFH